MDMAKSIGSQTLCCECGAILESMKQLPEAARMYELGSNFEKAAAIYIRCKDFSSATPLMDRIVTAKIHAQYAKAKEAAGDYTAAVQSYEKAKDTDSVVRLYIEKLNKPDMAFAIVRATASSNAAQMVARYCQTRADWVAPLNFSSWRSEARKPNSPSSAMK